MGSQITNMSSDHYYLLDGDMRIPKNSQLGKIMKKSFSIRNKRKIVNHVYPSGTTSRWPLKTIPYIFDSTICK